jgi:hypothetical protein
MDRGGARAPPRHEGEKLRLIGRRRGGHLDLRRQDDRGHDHQQAEGCESLQHRHKTALLVQPRHQPHRSACRDRSARRRERCRGCSPPRRSSVSRAGASAPASPQRSKNCRWIQNYRESRWPPISAMPTSRRSPMPSGRSPARRRRNLSGQHSGLARCRAVLSLHLGTTAVASISTLAAFSTRRTTCTKAIAG